MARAKPAKKASTPKRARKSRAEAFTGKKAASVEVRKIKVAEQQAIPMPKPADWKHHYATIKGYGDKLETAKGHLRNAVKAADEAHPGMAATIKRVQKLERTDPAEFKAEMALLGFGLAQIGSPVQLAIFDANSDPKKQARAEGFADGKAGNGASTRYAEGSDLHGLYMEGWLEGQGKMELFGKKTGAANGNGKGHGGDGRELDNDDNEHDDAEEDERAVA